jgi:hypothetical protein
MASPEPRNDVHPDLKEWISTGPNLAERLSLRAVVLAAPGKDNTPEAAAENHPAIFAAGAIDL